MFGGVLFSTIVQFFVAKKRLSLRIVDKKEAKQIVSLVAS